MEKILRQFEGVVSSAAMKKTITVVVQEMKLHRKYQKKYRVIRKFHVHDEKNEAKAGDMVIFVETRPLSKTKRWKLMEIKK